MANLDAAADHYDGFILDAYGVLNAGESAIPGAVARMASLRARGKVLRVLSNAASYTPAGAQAKYRRLGFDFAPDEIVTSRAVAAARLSALAPGATWAAICDAGDDLADLGVPAVDALDPGAIEGADAILFLSTARYDPAVHERLSRALVVRPRPFAVANPDIVSPRGGWLAPEPGHHAHDLIDRTGCAVHWFGKPYGDAFADVLALTEVPAGRLAMVGDTLHTDVLGGRAAGMGTVLVTDHGLFAGSDTGSDADAAIAASGIIPDIVVPTT
jgi:HAD superfamily hydrolase (TIGR01459 family)